MNWERRIIPEVELEPFLPKEKTTDFQARVQGLLAQQLKTWPMLREATEGLSQVEYKKLSVKGSEVLAQYNPKRIVSTAARVDAATISRRPCFLCEENLPSEEKGIEFGQDFIVLCNPFPVLRNHLVITARQHIPQRIEGNFGTLLDLSRELGEEWFTVYNGPKCGASAPDHLHFQACSRETLPIIREIDCWNRQTILTTSAIDAFTLRDYRINLMVVRSDDHRVVIDFLESALRRLARVTNATEEPMINMIATCEEERWTVILFPRSKHRPSCYDAEGDAKLTVSPAAIDLAGVLVVPQPDHFARISAEDVEKIYAEVTLHNEW